MKELLKKFSMVLALVAVFAFVACGPDKEDDNGKKDKVDPFAEIGTVILFEASTNVDFTGIDTVAALDGALASNQIAIYVDVSDSLYPLSNWDDHVPFLVGAFAGWVRSSDSKALAAWGFNPYGDDGNELSETTETDVYRIVIEFDLGDWDGDQVIGFKPANYLNTEAGKDAVTNNFWDNIGAPGGMDNYQFTVANDGGTLKVTAVEFGGSAPAGAKIVNNGKGVGWIVNGSVLDWVVQSAGLEAVLEAGTKIRVLWTDVPAAGELPEKGEVWDTFPQGAVITGNATWMHTDGESTWSPAMGKSVLVDQSKGLAAVTVTLAEDAPMGVAFKLANSVGWDKGEELNDHSGLLPSGISELTLKVKADFAIAAGE
jgi:hypothetical protein